MKLSITVNNKQVIGNLKTLKNALSEIDSELMSIAYEILRKSQKQVPHDKGFLQNSGTVESIAKNEVIIGYHTPYAAKLHEHPEYRFRKGRKGRLA